MPRVDPHARSEYNRAYMGSHLARLRKHAAAVNDARKVMEWLYPLLGPRRQARWEEVNGP